jgi:GNAT superfamily N-acetyltransferase
MNSLHSFSGVDEHAVVVTRVAERHWHALGDDLVVGRGEAWRRPDGRTFLSIDAWHGPVFDRLADAMLADLPRPLYTVVDEADLDVTSHVRADMRRRGVARTLLAHVLDSLHRRGIELAWAEVNESNGAALALFEGIGARRGSSNLELVLG